MKRLKVCVEAAVRPIRASQRRKDRMRDELLSHVTEVYGEEIARTNDEQAAVSAALLRFGTPADLSRELQATVPPLEALMFRSVPGFGVLDWLDSIVCLLLYRRNPKGELTRDQVRVTSLIMLFGTVVVALLLLVICFLRVSRSDVNPLFGELRILLGCTFFGVLSLASILFPAQATALGDLLFCPPTRRGVRLGSVVYSVLLGVALFAAGLPFLSSLEADMLRRDQHGLILAICALTAPWVQGAFLRLVAAEARRHEEWGQLDIAE